MGRTPWLVFIEVIDITATVVAPTGIAGVAVAAHEDWGTMVPQTSWCFEDEMKEVGGDVIPPVLATFFTVDSLFALLACLVDLFR